MDPELGDEFQAIHVGHVDIDDRECERSRADQPKGLEPVPGGRHGVPFAFEQAPDGGPSAGVVVDQEDVGHGFSFLSSFIIVHSMSKCRPKLPPRSRSRRSLGIFPMMPMQRALMMTLVAVAVAGAPALAQVRPPSWPAIDSTTWAAILEAEDHRAPALNAVAVLERALGHANPSVRVVAVRALGRLERPSVVPSITAALDDAEPQVRMEAVNALGQAVYGATGDDVVPILGERLDEERNASVRGTIVATLGRLALSDTALVSQVEVMLRGLSESEYMHELLGVVRGYQALLRANNQGFTIPLEGMERLAALAVHRSEANPARAARIRRLALVAAIRAGGPVNEPLATAIDDPDAEVRRLAVTVSSTAHDSVRRVVVERAMSDSAPSVRYAAWRALARDDDPTGCARSAEGAEDPDFHVRLLVIDHLARCGSTAGVRDLLLGKLQLSTTRAAWHQPAHALVALAHVAPDDARAVLPAFAGGQNAWLRRYAARAAGVLEDRSVLERLAFDDDDNVRRLAVDALSELADHEFDSVYVSQLAREDYQLIITATGALAGSPAAEGALPLILITLRRITLEERETSRDVRMALLERVAEFGNVQQVKALEPYLTDFDPAVAQRAAEIMGDWTGGEHRAAPRSPPAVPLPSLAEVEGLARARPVLVMHGGGEIELQLLPFEAPTNAARFARLARDGYFDGLTFHRVAPGFVIQGGSPGANEYAGDGPYTRDELGLRSHERGTVGVSTRGRDTGDGQIFINLVDNPRLDHNYTIFAVVVSGMDAVDAVLEGAVIERIEWRP